MCIDYVKLYITAVEFFENEHEERIDPDTLEILQRHLLSLNSKSSPLSTVEKQEIEDIFLIVFYNRYDSIWKNVVFSKEIAQIKNSLQTI